MILQRASQSPRLNSLRLTNNSPKSRKWPSQWRRSPQVMLQASEIAAFRSAKSLIAIALTREIRKLSLKSLWMSQRLLYNSERTVAISHLREASSHREDLPCTHRLARNKVISSVRLVRTRGARPKVNVDTRDLEWIAFKTLKYSQETQRLTLGQGHGLVQNKDPKLVLREAALKILLERRAAPWPWTSSSREVPRHPRSK